MRVGVLVAVVIGAVAIWRLRPPSKMPLFAPYLASEARLDAFRGYDTPVKSRVGFHGTNRRFWAQEAES